MGWCIGKAQRLKQARSEVQDEVNAYKMQCDEECKKQEQEVVESKTNFFF